MPRIQPKATGKGRGCNPVQEAASLLEMTMGEPVEFSDRMESVEYIENIPAGREEEIRRLCPREIFKSFAFLFFFPS